MTYHVLNTVQKVVSGTMGNVWGVNSVVMVRNVNTRAPTALMVYVIKHTVLVIRGAIPDTLIRTAKMNACILVVRHAIEILVSV